MRGREIIAELSKITGYLCGESPKSAEVVRRLRRLADRVEAAGAKSSKTKARKPDPHSEAADRLFEYWRSMCRPAAKPVEQRLRKVRARLREGYTEAQIRAAIDGAAQAPTVGDDGRVFDDLELICRDAPRLDGFIERAGGTMAVTAAAETNPKIEELRERAAKAMKEKRTSDYNAIQAELRSELARGRSVDVRPSEGGGRSARAANG